MMIHPFHTTAPTQPTLAIRKINFEFFGRASHAAAAPEKGINALDAMILFYNGINAMRQQLPKGVLIHGVITDGERLLILFLLIRRRVFISELLILSYAKRIKIRSLKLVREQHLRRDVRSPMMNHSIVLSKC